MNIDINPDWWKTMFDEVYLLTDSRSVCDENITRLEVDLICKLLPIQPDHRILDFCGGHGRHSFELCARGFNACILLDYSQHLIDIAKKQADRFNYPTAFVRSDARNTGLLSKSFDHVCLMGNSIGYLPSPDADRQIIGEAYRLLRPGGWLMVDVTDGKAVKNSFNPNAWHEIGNKTMVCRQRELHGNTIHAREIVLDKQKGLVRDRTYAIRLYEAKSLEELLEKTGFRSITVHTNFSPHQSKGDYGFMNNRMIAVGQKP